MAFRNRGWFVLVAVLAVSGLPAGVPSASAQELPRGVTVTERPRPELDPLGLRVGGFLIFPAFAVSERYDDNIFRQDTGEIDDFITSFQPSVALRSQWSNHALNVHGTADVARYAEQSDENFQDYDVGFDGRIDITRNANLFGAATYAQHHEDRGSPDDVRGVEPGEFTTLTGKAGYFQRFGRFNGTLTGDVVDYNFDDVATSTGAIINNDDRDRNKYVASVRLAYEILPEYEAFVKASYNTGDYDDGVDDNGFDRDSHGYEIAAGTMIDFSGVTFGEVFAGVQSQEFDDPQLNTVEGPSFGGAITWNVTGLTTVKAFVRRTIEESTIAAASGFFATTIGGSVDHELLRNLLLHAHLRGTRSDYEGIDREDDLITVNAGGKYLLNRHLYISLDYEYLERGSNIAGQDYNANRFMLRLSTQY